MRNALPCRPADLLKPEYEEVKKKVIELGYYEKEEDVLSYAVFEQVAENFFKWRAAHKDGVDKDLAKTGVYPYKVYSEYAFGTVNTPVPIVY